MSYQLPRTNEYRCQCGKIVRLSNTYTVPVIHRELIDGQCMTTKSFKRVCIRCKQRAEIAQRLDV